jgi:transcriptional regulator with XRE-family HTH domain
MRKINLNELNLWLMNHGDLAKEDLASRARIKFHTIKRIVEGKKMPSELEQTAICKATGLSRDLLFPVVENKKESA